MRKQFALLLTAIFLLSTLLGACRRGEEETATAVPTIAPTAALPETAEPSPTALPAGPEADEPTPAVPETAVDPDEIDWPPQVVYSSPAPGESVLLDGAITIRFDQPMDQQSVESAFEIAAAGGEKVDGRFSWPRADTLVFTPDQLERKQTYRLRIDEQATAANGLTLPLPVELDLETIGFLRVSQVVPAPGTDGVQTDSAITVIFNRPVVPLVSSGQQADLPQPLLLDPPTAGSGEWISTSIYRFTPETALDGAAAYSAEIDPTFTDFTGGGLEQPYSWSFTTLRPDVVSTTPEDDAQNVPLDDDVTVTFNMPMDRDATETAVRLQNAAGESVDVVYGWSEGNRVLTLKPRDSLQLETGYRLVIGQSAAAANGAATLAEETVIAFNSVRAPAVVDTMPPNGGETDRWQRGFTVRFASPMDPETLIDQLSILPEPTSTVRYFYNEYSFELNVDFNLEFNSTYRVTVPSSAADPYGNTLEEAYRFSFTTPGRPPIAALNLPADVAQLSTAFESQVEVIVTNVSRTDLTLTNVGLPLGLLNRPYDVRDYRPAADPLQTWSFPIDIPQNEVTTFSLSLADGGTLPTGVYLLSLTAPETTEDVRYWQNQRTLLVMADTNIVVKQTFEAVHVWVTDLRSGEPAANRSLTLYSEQGVQVGTAVSDANGFAAFDYQPLNEYFETATVVSEEPGAVGFGIGSTAWQGSNNPWQLGIPYVNGDESDQFAYLYTDRPIYRPGDTVYFKGIVRDANYGRYNLPNPQLLDINLYQASYFSEQQFNETLTVEVGPDGSFNGSYELSEGLALGSYEFSFPNLSFETVRRFTVAEYRRPEFLVSLTPDATDALRGETVDVVLQADYFFGGSAADLPVSWNVYESSFRLDPPGPYFAYGDDGSFNYEDPGFFFGGGGGPGNLVLSGEGTTDSDGRFVITLPADMLQDADEGSRTVTVEASVSDLSNFPISTRTELTFHAAALYAGVSPTDPIGAAGTETAVDIRTVDWDGNPVGRQEVQVIFYRREWEPVRTQEFGVYYTRWEAVDTEVARDLIVTDTNGNGSAAFTPEEGGTYLAVATVTDDAGRENLSSALIWVTDNRFVGWQLDPRNKLMDLVLDRQSYQVGDTAQVLVQSPFTEPVNAWLTIERGGLIEQELITLAGGSAVIDVPITAGYAPNVFVSIIAMKGVTPDAPNPYADIRMGIAEIPVDPAQLALNVELTPQQTQFVPGETATYDIRVTDYAGNPVQADLSLALVDLAVLTLKDDNAPPILEAFYSPQPLRSQVGTGLFISGEGRALEIPNEGGGLGGGGGGDSAEEALARAAGDEEDEGVRRDFPDTAFWEATITTDADGRATVDIPLPDTLTTWRLSSKAVTAETLVGQNSVDIVTSLPLLVRPVTPRFFTVGDVMQLGAIVNNNTDSDVEAAVSVTVDGLSPAAPPTQTVTVPANGQRLVQWDVSVNDVEYVDLTFRVEGGGYSDATKPSFGEGPDNLIPVYRFSARDVVASSGVLDEAGRVVEAILLPPGLDDRQGDVQVNLSPSLAAAALASLQAANELPLDTSCPSSLASRLLANAVTADTIRTLDLDEAALLADLDGLVETAVARLVELPLADGGWGWCYSDESNPFITTQVLLALLQARGAGYDVPGGVLADGRDYLLANTAPPQGMTEPWRINRQVMMLYVLAQLGEVQPSLLDAHVEEHRTLLDPYAKALLALVYHENDISPDYEQALLADLNDVTALSATGAHWEDENRDFRNLSSDVRSTAIVLYALSTIEPENALLPQAVRWLMTARTASFWPTLHETAWSLQALTAYMAASGELDANFGYAVAVNLTEQASGAFTADDLTETETVETPVSQLAANDVNFVDVQRGAGDGRLYYTLFLDSAIDVSQVSAISRGFTIERTYTDAACDPETETCEPLTQITAGQQVRVELTITAPEDRLYAVITDPIPAGAEAIDPNLETSASGFAAGSERTDVDYRYGYWGWWVFNRIEFRDDAVAFLAEFLPAGTYQYTYFLQASIPGTYQVRPTFAHEQFFPEVNGRSDGMIFEIVAD